MHETTVERIRPATCGLQCVIRSEASAGGSVFPIATCASLRTHTILQQCFKPLIILVVFLFWFRVDISFGIEKNKAASSEAADKSHRLYWCHQSLQLLGGKCFLRTLLCVIEPLYSTSCCYQAFFRGMKKATSRGWRK